MNLLKELKDLHDDNLCEELFALDFIATLTKANHISKSCDCTLGNVSQNTNIPYADIHNCVSALKCYPNLDKINYSEPVLLRLREMLYVYIKLGNPDIVNSYSWYTDELLIELDKEITVAKLSDPKIRELYPNEQ